MRWWSGGALVAALALGVGFTGIAVAVSHVKVKSGPYTGTLAPTRPEISVSFKVSPNGKRITGLTISDTPFYCQGGGRAIPERFANASISKSGSFTSTGKFVIKEGPFKGQLSTKLKITGKFGPGGIEHGTVTSTWTKSPECTGKSSYTTKQG
jgi:hypothetical protein